MERDLSRVFSAICHICQINLVQKQSFKKESAAQKHTPFSIAAHIKEYIPVLLLDIQSKVVEMPTACRPRMGRS